MSATAIARAEAHLRRAWLAVVIAVALIAGAREQLRRVAGEHDAECERLRGQLDGALEHISEIRREQPAPDVEAPVDDAPA